MIRSVSKRLIVEKPDVSLKGKEDSLIYALLTEDFATALTKVKSEARKSVSVRADGGKRISVLPIHIACAIPTTPLNLIECLVKAYPKALMRYTKLKRISSSEQRMPEESSNDRHSSFSTIPSQENAAIGIGWLPIHVAALYGVPTNTLDYLLAHAPSSIYCKTTQGFLTLHIACRAIENSQHLIEKIVKVFPESTYIPTSGGLSAVEIVKGNSEDNYSEITKLLVTREGPINHSTDTPRPSQNIQDKKPSSVIKKVFSSIHLQDMSKEQVFFEAISQMQWSFVASCLLQKPKYAKVWTLSSESFDPPCHLLPLHLALRRNAPLHIIKGILNANPNAIYKREFMGMLPLHLACNLGMDYKVIKFLHKSFPEASKRADFTGMLPLHYACKSKNPNNEVITYLLKQNPSGLRERDKKGFRPQECLSSNNSLLKEFERGESYWRACNIIENKLASLILEEQWDAALVRVKEAPMETKIWTINKDNHLRYLPLHYACIHKAPIELIKALLDAYPSAALTRCQEYDMLPLHLAIQSCSGLDVIEALLKYNELATSVTDSFELLPLHLACTQGAKIDVISALVNAFPGACDATDRNGYTPKIYAKNSMLPHSKMVLRLLESPENTIRQER